MTRVATLCALALAALVVTGTGSASQLIDRNAQNVKLAVDAQGEAMVTYRTGGAVHHVLAWGASNALQPTRGRAQVAFKLDYSGRRWASFKGACRAYDGPSLAFLVTACATPDGSYWALQAWQRTLPNFDGRPTPRLGKLELRLSHWSGPVAVLEAWTDWVYGGRFHHLFGRYTYAGQPVHGFSATTVGNPTDTYGRNVYVDTFDSRYGKGWHRENAFLSHNPTGVFCYGFYKFTPRGPGNGSRYRLSAIGPGVTPDVSITLPGLHDYDSDNAADVAYEQQRNALQDSIVANDAKCKVH